MGNKTSKEEITKQYIIKQKIGSGSFAQVKRCIRRKDNKEFAVKIIKMQSLNKEELGSLEDEVNILTKLKHPGVVKLYDVFRTKKHFYIILEMLHGGELFDRIVKKGHFSESDAARMTEQITLAIDYLHGKGVVHRDLKPENLLFDSKRDDANLKITDFGLAKYIEGPVNADDDPLMKTACGTPGYVAPEILRKNMYGPACDMWSLGVILYILLCGFPPFGASNVKDLYRKIRRVDFSFPKPYWTNISDDAKDLVKHLLNGTPKDRYTPKDVLKHKWIQKEVHPERRFGKDYMTRLQKTILRGRFIKGIIAIIAINRFKARFADSFKIDVEDEAKQRRQDEDALLQGFKKTLPAPGAPPAYQEPGTLDIDAKKDDDLVPAAKQLSI